jgi:hypothetical protein
VLALAWYDSVACKSVDGSKTSIRYHRKADRQVLDFANITQQYRDVAVASKLFLRLGDKTRRTLDPTLTSPYEIAYGWNRVAQHRPSSMQNTMLIHSAGPVAPAYHYVGAFAVPSLSLDVPTQN